MFRTDHVRKSYHHEPPQRRVPLFSGQGARWLRVQVFASGFAVMALELLGSRLITPVFGSSIWTWGSLIGVVLAGLSIGYQAGGRLADRSPSMRKFSTVLFLGGILTVLVPLLAPFAVQVSVNPFLGDQYGPLLATSLILGVQTVVLGMTTPYAVRIASKSVDSVGNVAGTLYSVSTVGSIVGTFGTVFVLIPAFDIRAIISVLGVALMVVSVPLLPRRSSIAAVILLALIISPTFVQAAPQATLTKNGGWVAYEKETPYSILDVVNYPGVRLLYLNGLIHSGEDLANTTRLYYQYSTYFNLGMQLNPEAKNVLFVGGGGFSGPKFFLSAYPQVHIDVAEIDPDVIDAARNYFDLRPDPRLTIFNEDGRVYLGETTKDYDVVVLDAYAKTYVPFHLMTEEFFSLLSSHLTQKGVVVSNLIGSIEGDTSKLIRSYYSTLSRVYDDSALFQVDTTDRSTVQNVEFVFRRQHGPMIASAIEQVEGNFSSGLAQAAAVGMAPTGGYQAHIVSSAIPVDDVPVLTDNFSPVEALLNPITGHPYTLEQEYGRLVTTTQLPQGTTILLIGEASALTGWWLFVTLRRKGPGAESPVGSESSAPP